MYATDTLMDEREVVLRLIDGDEEAFCELYAAYKNRLLYFALKFVKSHEFAEDIFQDAFTVVWQTRRFINPEASFSSYLYTIVRNRILNQLRDMANEDQLKEQILSQAIDSTNETNNHILLNDYKEIVLLVELAFNQLPPRRKQVFEMSRIEGLSHKEIAEALGVSVHTVQEHISLSLKVIRSYLTKYSSTSADVLLILLCLNL